ncbi:acylphosphatase [Olivibacter domesticus]|uniref:Acylphosphatase n=1 Tax=Olivibacter domesticus TaxID=407022 RepID=A0A1H7SLV1_OLID1|nr:acylphosphatase [Olivibacter domesticus]SEL73630.1 acylphosphatase [Olivibacter domesticus]
MKHLNITIYGKVQGVSFRITTKAVANQLGVTGFVKNQADGSVYVEAEGQDFELDNFVDWCNEGPEGAQVEKVEIFHGELQNYRNFEIAKR